MTDQYAPILAPLKSTLGVLQPYYAKESTTLVLREKIASFSGADYSVKTVQGTPVLRVKGTFMSLSGRTTVVDTSDQALFTIRREVFSIPASYYAEDPQGSKFLRVDGEFSFGGNKASISFVNSGDGENIRLKMKGNIWDTEAEIKYGDAVIARIDRKIWNASSFLGNGLYHVTIAPNVDMALMVAVCICLDERRRKT